MRVALLLLSLLAAGAWPLPAAANDPTAAPRPFQVADIFKAVAGKWAWEGTSCSDSAHTLSFSADRAHMTYKAGKPFKSATGATTDTSRYNVLYAEDNKITMYLEGETRRTGNGDRVIWVLVLQNPDTYAWRRTDWAADSVTKKILRCAP